jgi:hypothetical protein
VPFSDTPVPSYWIYEHSYRISAQRVLGSTK